MYLQKLSTTVVVLNLMGVAHAAQNQNNETITLWIWIAIFALATIGLSILYLSARQAQNLQKLQQKILEKQLAMEKSQNVFL